MWGWYNFPTESGHLDVCLIEIPLFPLVFLHDILWDLHTGMIPEIYIYIWVVKQDSSHFFRSDSVYAIPTYWGFSPDTSNSKYEENLFIFGHIWSPWTIPISVTIFYIDYLGKTV